MQGLLRYSGGDVSDKPFKTIDEQITLLKSRNLLFQNEEYSKKLLLRYGYYEIINGYKLFLLDNDESEEEHYQDGATFEHIYALFELDRNLRAEVLESTLIIESSLCTALSYVLAEEFGHNQSEYLNRRNFKYGPPSGRFHYKIDQLLNKFNNIINDDVQPMKHYRERHGNVPPWIMVKGISFGNLLHFIKLQKSPCKNNLLSIASGLPNTVLENDASYKQILIEIITLCHSYRNRAAHTGRIYNYLPKNNHGASIISYSQIFHSTINISDMEYYRKNKGKGDLYTLLGALSWFENKTPEQSLQFAIDYHLGKHVKLYPEDIPYLLESMGFPEDYKGYLRYSE